MENLITYIWKHKLPGKKGLQTTSGEPLEILDYGQQDSRIPDLFREGKVSIDGKTKCGNIILVTDGEPATDEQTILRVTLGTAKSHKPGVYTLQLHCPDGLEDEFNAVAGHRERFPCQRSIAGLSGLQLHSHLSRLLIERIEEKTVTARKFLERSNSKWEEAFTRMLIRSFGFGIQSNAFEEWAECLDLHAIGKHSDNTAQVEAILFGQAGLLDEESIPYYYKESARNSQYLSTLQREYKFLENKFMLKKLKHSIWNFGNSTPHVRIARIAAIIEKGEFSLTNVCDAETITDLYKILDAPLEGYWQNHTCFGGTETVGNGKLTQRHADIIIINAIAPMLYVYGKHRKDERLCNKAEDFLHWIKGEENSITKRWKTNGVPVDCAADSQAVIQLHKRYCTGNNCIECCFAYRYIKDRIAEIL